MAHVLLRMTAAAGVAILFFMSLRTDVAYGSVKKNVGESLGVIVEKDLFRPARQKPKPPRRVAKKAPKPLAAPPVPKSPPPRLTLFGTVLLDTGSVALMSLQGPSSGLAGLGSGRYEIGDEIEGFRITEITGENVVLRRDGEILKVFLNSGQGVFQGAPAFANSQPNTTQQNQQQADIPPALVPRPQNPFARAVPGN